MIHDYNVNTCQYVSFVETKICKLNEMKLQMPSRMAAKLMT
jgi:hypothetical protein